jgi:hypothetical protein
MPTSDADRYAQLLQNLAVRLGAIREAIEVSAALSKLPKKSVVLAGAEFGCFCT